MIFYRDVRKLVADKGGSTAIEYALIGSLVSIAILVSVTQLGGDIVNLFKSVTASIMDAYRMSA